ncbi:MAG: PspC domain-containing protein [Bacillota bacterium]
MSKQLKRSKTEKSIHGVCGGLANHFDVPPFLVRLLFIFTLPGSFLFYIILANTLPEDLTDGYIELKKR